jgi:uncharacterized protein YjdB
VVLAIAAGTFANSACPVSATGTDSRTTVLGVQPASFALAVGQTQTLAIDARGQNGQIVGLLNTQATWSSGAPAIASVDADGVVRGVSPGIATITMSYTGSNYTSQVTVTAAASVVSSVAVLPGSGAIPAGERAQLSAVAYDAQSRVIGGKTAAWSSSNDAVATVDATGLVSGIAPGTATITATIDGKPASVTVTVVNRIAGIRVSPKVAYAVVDEKFQLAWRLVDAAGQTVVVPPGLWVDATTFGYNDANAATIDIKGVVTARPGSRGDVWANYGSFRDSSEVRVRPEVSTLVLRPNPLTIGVGDTVTVGVSYLDLNSLEITALATYPAGKRGTIAVANGAIVQATDDGNPKAVGQLFVRGLAPGQTMVTLSIDGISATLPVTVESKVASVSVTPSPLDLVVGTTGALVAAPLDAKGAPVANAGVVTWSASPSGIVSVAGGLVSALAEGTATVTATIAGVSGQATVRVAPATTTASSLNLSPSSELTIKLLADDTRQTFDGLLVAGDHEETGDKYLQAFATYSLATLPAGATITSAKLTVIVNASGTTGDPFSLGALLVEGAPSATLSSGGPSTFAVPVTTSADGFHTVDITAIVRSMVNAGQRDAIVRFRFVQLQNGNSKTDYQEIVAGGLEVKYTK